MKHSTILCVALAMSLSPAFAGDGLEAMLDELMTRHQNGADAPKEFDIQEDEANAYVREQSVEKLPEGIENPWVRFEESLAIVGATLDLDKLQGQLPDSMILQLLSGRVPVEVTTRIVAAAGVGKLVLERVTLSGIELPPDMVASLISNEDASEFLPPGFRLGEAFALPFDLESIQCLPGTVKLVQRATAASK
jgi:hypothetical protein